MLLLVIVLGMVLKGMALLAANQQVGYAVAHVATDLRLGLIRALLRTRWEYYVHQPVGAVANAVASEARRASDAYRHATMIVSLLIQTCVYAVVAFLVSWQAMMVALVAGAVILYLFNHLVQMARRAGMRQTRLAKSLLGRLTDTLQAVKPLKAMAREPLIGTAARERDAEAEPRPRARGAQQGGHERLAGASHRALPRRRPVLALTDLGHAAADGDRARHALRPDPRLPRQGAEGAAAPGVVRERLLGGA